MNKFLRPPIGVCAHHSLTRDGKVPDAVGIRHYHMHPAYNGVTITQDEYNRLKALSTKGLKPAWSECGYHELYERVNGVLTRIAGRPLLYQGAHCPALNATHFGVCIVGNFDIAAPDKELLDFAAVNIVKLMTENNIERNQLAYHCDYDVKSCPGRLFPKAGFRLAVAGEVRP